MVKPKILYFDIETAPLQAWIWQPGKQYVGHKQLIEGYDEPRIICLAYCWGDGPVKSLDWGYEEQDSRQLVQEFDEIVRQADHIIGKNSDRFDVKMVNAVRMLNGLPGLPEWMKKTDDLEKQMRKYFRLPSQSLDYISKHLGFGGKDKMEMQDWIDISVKNKDGKDKLRKMIKYCKKDVSDTRELWYRLSEHFDPKFNMSTHTGNKVCKWADCGSENIYISSTPVYKSSKYNVYRCNECKRYAGCTTQTSVGGEGRLR